MVFVNVDVGATQVECAYLCEPADESSGTGQRPMLNQPLEHSHDPDIIDFCPSFVMDDKKFNVASYSL